MSNAVHGYGTSLQVADAVGVYTTVAEVKSIDGPQLDGNVVDVTNMDSSQGWREKIVTLMNAGQISFEVNYIPTGATHNATTGVLSLLKNRTKRNWKITYPDTGATVLGPFEAYVQSFRISAPLEGVLTGAVTLEVTGIPTLA